MASPIFRGAGQVHCRAERLTLGRHAGYRSWTGEFWLLALPQFVYSRASRAVNPVGALVNHLPVKSPDGVMHHQRVWIGRTLDVPAGGLGR